MAKIEFIKTHTLKGFGDLYTGSGRQLLKNYTGSISGHLSKNKQLSVSIVTSQYVFQSSPHPDRH